MSAVAWLVQVLPLIYTYAYPAKTLSQLLQDAQNPQPGYQIHHIVEQTPARQDGFPNAQVDAPDNLVMIPTLKHWQITGWYGVPTMNSEDYRREIISGARVGTNVCVSEKMR